MYPLSINHENNIFRSTVHFTLGLTVENPKPPPTDRKLCKLCIVQTGCLSVESYRNDTLACIDTLGRQCSQLGIPYYMCISGIPEDLSWLSSNPLSKTMLKEKSSFVTDISIPIDLNIPQDEKLVNILDFSSIIHDFVYSGPYKLFYGLKKALEDYDPEVIWMLDGDCTINLENALKFILQIDINHNFHIGNSLYAIKEFGNDGRMHEGGCGYMITRALANNLYGHLDGFQERWEKNYCVLYERDRYRNASDISIVFLVALVGGDHLIIDNRYMPSRYNLFNEKYQEGNRWLSSHYMNSEMIYKVYYKK